MPGTPVDVGTGSSVVFGTSGFSAQILNIDLSGISRESIDTTHLATTPASTDEFGGKTSIPGDLSDAGSVELEMHFNPETLPPIDQPPETITLTFPLAAGDSVPAKYVGTGYFTDNGMAIPLEDKMTMTGTVKFTGVVTRTGAV